MVAVQNSVVNSDYRKIVNLSLLELPALNVGSTLQPVFIVDSAHKEIKIANAERVVSGGDAIFTFNTNETVFLKEITLSFSKNAACDVGSGFLTVRATPFGQLLSDIIRIPILNLTAEYNTITIPFDMRIASGSAVTMLAQTYAAGLFHRNIVIQYYTESNWSNA